MKYLWLTVAYLCCVVGFAWLALAMESHWQQLRGAQALPRGQARVLRVRGGLALAASLWACLRADHAAMASLVWLMLLAAAALTVALVLSWRPRLLAPLVVWVGRQAAQRASG